MHTITSTISYDNPRALIYGLHVPNAPDLLAGHVNPAHPPMGAASLTVLSPPLAASLTLRYKLLTGIMTMCL